MIVSDDVNIQFSESRGSEISQNSSLNLEAPENIEVDGAKH